MDCAKWLAAALLGCAVLVCAAAQTQAAGPAFTYQGQLKENDAPANGVFDFQFTLLQANGTTVVERTCAFNVVVVNGLFQAEPEYAASSFDGSPRLLQVGVRNAVGGVIHDCSSNTIGFLFDLLTPLQPITAAPYAIHALSTPPGSSLDAPDGSPVNALVVDNAGRVGIGTTTPAAILDVVGATPLLRLTNTNNTGPTFQTVNPTPVLNTDHIGRLSFSLGSFGADGSSRAEITYGNNLNDSLRFSFVSVSGLTSTVEPMRILRDGNVGIGTPTPSNMLSVNGSADFSGNVGIGTVQPSQRLHVSNGSSGGVSQSGAELLVEDNTSCYVNIMAPDASERGVSFGSPANSVHGGVYYTNAGGLNLRTNGNLVRMSIDANGDVGVGVTGSIDARLHVQESGRVAKFDRFGSDGEIVTFARDDLTVGSVTVTGGVVSYNAFTGSHYAWSADAPSRGALVSMTGDNRRLSDRADLEVVYGVAITARANDPTCLGAYLDTLPGQSLDSPFDIRLITAVGNGDMWVVDRGAGDIEPGDYLVSSDVPGHAMKDDPARFPVGYVVARAAERVRWNDVQADELDGAKHRRISVFFESFIRNNSADRLAAEVQKLRETLESQQREIEAMRSLLSGQRSVANRDGS